VVGTGVSIATAHTSARTALVNMATAAIGTALSFGARRFVDLLHDTTPPESAVF
jgi:hypothetical protein